MIRLQQRTPKSYVKNWFCMYRRDPRPVHLPGPQSRAGRGAVHRGKTIFRFTYLGQNPVNNPSEDCFNRVGKSSGWLE